MFLWIGRKLSKGSVKEGDIMIDVLFLANLGLGIPNRASLN